MTTPPPRQPWLMLHAALHAFGDLLSPQSCAGCGGWTPSEDGVMCRTCAAALARLAALPYCGRCARTMRPEALHERGCARCDHEHFWNIGGVVRIGPYSEPLRRMVLDLKYHGTERNAVLLASILAGRLEATPWYAAVDALAPVPMHWLRRLQRPCAHAGVLAAALGRATHKPVLRAVRRVRYAPSQTLIPVRARRFSNVAESFAPKRAAIRRTPSSPAPSGGPLAGKTICIVDNILMSGATIHEVSKVLRAAGARKIYLAVIARSIVPGDFQADESAFAAF